MPEVTINIDVVELYELARHISDMLGYMLDGDFTQAELRRVYDNLKRAESVLEEAWDREGL